MLFDQLHKNARKIQQLLAEQRELIEGCKIKEILQLIAQENPGYNYVDAPCGGWYNAGLIVEFKVPVTDVLSLIASYGILEPDNIEFDPTVLGGTPAAGVDPEKRVYCWCR